MPGTEFTDAAFSDTWPVDSIYAESVCKFDDVYYNGSEDDNYADPDSRKTRYEAAGQRFLDGHVPLLLTASMRGPFDKASGWKNPWASRRIANTLNSSAAVKTEASLSKPAVRNNGLKSPVCNVEGYLPSPESLKQSPAVQHPFLDSEKVDDMHDWRNHVVTRTEIEDSFWEPPEAGSKTPTKRRLEQDLEWLASTPSKRPRVGANRTARKTSSPPRRAARSAEAHEDTAQHVETRDGSEHIDIAAGSLASPMFLKDLAKAALDFGMPSPSKSSELSPQKLSSEFADIHAQAGGVQEPPSEEQQARNSERTEGESSFRSFLTRLVPAKPWAKLTQLASSPFVDQSFSGPQSELGASREGSAKELDTAASFHVATEVWDEEDETLVEAQLYWENSPSRIHDGHGDGGPHGNNLLTKELDSRRKALQPLSPNAGINPEVIATIKDNEYQTPALPKAIARSPRQATPEPQFDVKPFASFLSPSPLKPSYAALNSRAIRHQGQRRSVLKRYTGSREPGLQVTWAESVESQKEEESRSLLSRNRQSSPPPEPLTEESQDVADGKFQKHFDAVANRKSATPQDVVSTNEDVDTILHDDSQQDGPAVETVTMPDTRSHDFDTEEPLDIVEDMLCEMGDFWDTWNVDAELDQARRAQAPAQSV